jgi:hypothetical protein
MTAVRTRHATVVFVFILGPPLWSGGS